MSYVEEAAKLLSDGTELTIAKFERLIWYRKQSKGREAVLINRMMETFIMRAPLNVLTQIAEIVSVTNTA